VRIRPLSLRTFIPTFAIMTTLRDTVQRQIALREQQGIQITLLAACPNSAAVLEAAVLTAARNGMPMLFAATLNQVDLDGGYTGWTPQAFVAAIDAARLRYGCTTPLLPCLDHGGPWLKDHHTAAGLSLDATMDAVRQSLSACIEAGYALLHIDPTVDRMLPANAPVPIDLVVERTVDLIAHAERERARLGAPPIAYEVGTEEVHGGLVDMVNFTRFLDGLEAGLAAQGLSDVWPAFIVGKVGTDLHTSFFDPVSAEQLYGLVAPRGSLIKGHYTDWVENPESYPATGMGGANVGPEFTAAEYLALLELSRREADMLRGSTRAPARLMEALEAAVDRSGRWRKWLQPSEVGRPLAALEPERRSWMVQTSARYIWTDGDVQSARAALYASLAQVMADPHAFVVERIALQMERYVTPFHLFGSQALLE
jgi:tagatose-1,6-bisphosphate aldolase non-catalytic subunit AgaZ/GatZ